MRNAFGSPQSLLVLGGTSDIALATARLLITKRVTRVVLAGRDVTRQEQAAGPLRALGADVRCVHFDALDIMTHQKVLGELFAAEEFDAVLMAFGLLGRQRDDESNPVAAARIGQVNYVGAVSAGLVCAEALRAQGHGALIVLSSIAAVRVRRSNFIYGSAKAGLDAFAQGLGDALHGSGVHVMVVRPGFVTTKMTAGLRRRPFATTPEAVARAIAAALRSRTGIVWAPPLLRTVMTVVRLLPRSVLRRIPV
ncbi:decaprenylphospho-beta-D-erythro-pentofuranosid-2-ulose 2-reductase [Streptomyces sp. NPDC049099]|uniref:decaprenylphospho-beta-D-erythro-pentofuranosid- 2-ulose 2-reductase n=1 Tax=Streptomyces sp. NPDC049099 TaxID=3155768 RepID=UPI00343E4A37